MLKQKVAYKYRTWKDLHWNKISNESFQDAQLDLKCVSKILKNLYKIQKKGITKYNDFIYLLEMYVENHSLRFEMLAELRDLLSNTRIAHQFYRENTK